ncbi:MAG: PTS N-acetylgalactosamine transporter subunit IIC [Angelakisella sp.]
MEMSQALLLALVAGLAGVDYYMEVFQTYRPLVLGTIIGFIMGDVTTGLVIGATFELMWMGLMPIGGAQPPNMVIGTVIGVVFAIASGEGASTAIGIGVPFSILMQGVITLLYTTFAVFMPVADKHADKGNGKGIERIQFSALAIVFVCYFVIAFFPIYLGADKAQFIISLMPEWIVTGLSVAGGIMPAIGFAILLNTMFRVEYIIFLVVGFIMVAYLGLPILAVSALAACIAIYDYYVYKPKAATEGVCVSQEEYNDGI